ncbi:MAG: DUF3857 domain-containing protein [Tahibacter sp.]
MSLAVVLLLTAFHPQALAETYRRGEFAFEVAAAPAWVRVSDVATKWDPSAPGAQGSSWRNWLLDSQFARFGGRRWRYFDRASEAISPELLSEAGKFEVEFNPEFQRLIIHELAVRRDGHWLDRLNPEHVTLARRESEFERDMSTGSVSAMIVLDDLRLGDVVRARFSIDGENPIMAGLDSDGSPFAWNSPLLQRQMRVLFDPAAKPAEFRAAPIAPASVTKTPEYLEWRYAAHFVAAINDEDNAPIWYRTHPQVVVSEKRSWGDVARWARSLYPPPAPLPDDLLQRIEQWRQLPDVEKRVAAALRTVQEEVRYFGIEIGDNTHRPAEPAAVWTQRHGDCKDKSRLLVAILAAMDIEAYPAMVNANRGKAIAELPPSADAFDHVIVQVRAKSGIWWLDPTRTQQRGRAAAQETSDFGVALPVAADTTGLVAVARNPDFTDRTSVSERFEPDADGATATLSVRSEYVGAAANRARYDLQRNGNDEVSRHYADFYRRRYSEVDVAAALQVEDEAERNRLVVTERYRLAKPWTLNTGSERALDLTADTIANSVALPATLDRHMPLALAFPAENTHRFELKMPAGWRWKGESTKRELVDPAAAYTYRAGVDGDVVFSEESYAARQASVGADRVAEHLRWRREVREQTFQRWIVALPSAVADQARKTRLNDLVRGVMDGNKANKDKKHD